jgi:hopanoid C-2 methylase
MKSPVDVRHRRRILCVFPRYAPSFGTFQYAYPLMDGVRAFMPPQGILVVAAYLPQAWEVRLVDENIRPVCRRPTVKISDMLAPDATHGTRGARTAPR